jgi:hypothetical protein
LGFAASGFADFGATGHFGIYCCGLLTLAKFTIPFTHVFKSSAAEDIGLKSSVDRCFFTLSKIYFVTPALSNDFRLSINSFRLLATF